MSMTPWQRYQHDLEKPGFMADDAQLRAVELLQQLYDDLLQREQARQTLSARLRRWWSGTSEPAIGLYFWGGVGRGKTYLVDTFFDALPLPDKSRVHFHRFMQRVHDELTTLAGAKNPLDLVADRIAREARILCFDEFFVSDIADAMLLGNLMQALFRRGVTLVATSNIEPKDLYKDGLQRERFVPAIDLLYRYTRVVNVDSGVDYRLRTLERAELYHWPLDSGAEKALEDNFTALANGYAGIGTTITINHRPVLLKRATEGMAWMTFDELCRKPRSASDFIELSRIYQTVLLEGVPIMSVGMEDAARRFINLVDEFYDRSVKLIMSAEAPAERLYQGSRLEFEFKRTLSRLQEMQSKTYLAREHQP